MATIIKKLKSGNEVIEHINNPFAFVSFFYRNCSMNLPLKEVIEDIDFVPYGAISIYLCEVDKGETVNLETGDKITKN